MVHSLNVFSKTYTGYVYNYPYVKNVTFHQIKLKLAHVRSYLRTHLPLPVNATRLVLIK